MLEFFVAFSFFSPILVTEVLGGVLTLTVFFPSHMSATELLGSAGTFAVSPTSELHGLNKKVTNLGFLVKSLIAIAHDFLTWRA